MYNTKLHPNCDLKWTYFLRDANLCSTSQLGALSERPLELVKDLEKVDRDGAETEVKGATLTYPISRRTGGFTHCRYTAPAQC